MKRRSQAGERRPLRHRLEVVDRLGGLYLNDAQQLPSPFALQDEIGKPRRRSTDRRGLLIAGVDGDVELSLIFRLKQADDAVVLELLPDWPDEDWAHTTSVPIDDPAANPASKVGEYSIMTPVPSPPASPDTPPRVLIVDDDVSVTDTFSRMLRLEGYEVWAALSADEGLRLAQTHRPHAVILDLRMPLTSGLQFLRAIRAIPGLTGTPVAIVTGDYYLDDAQSNEIRELGAELRYKPLWLEELVTLARELLNTPVRD
jgi:CheY-like chemotaxis protein